MTKLEIRSTEDIQFDFEYPERLIQCRQCKKKFITRFDAKYCSDKCFNTMIREHRKKIGTWVKANKRVYTKSTHRPDKNWRNPE